jgi:hypothetical protein
MSMTAARSITRLRQSLPGQHPNPKATSFAGAAAVTVGALAALALVNRYFAKKAVHDNPPAGRFLDLNGVRIHYVERGSGEPLVLLHGNGSMIQDFESSGLIDLAAKSYRVIVSIVPALATVIARVTSFGRRIRRPNCSKRLLHV